jgi:hypothetical protein
MLNSMYDELKLSSVGIPERWFIFTPQAREQIISLGNFFERTSQAPAVLVEQLKSEGGPVREINTRPLKTIAAVREFLTTAVTNLGVHGGFHIHNTFRFSDGGLSKSDAPKLANTYMLLNTLISIRGLEMSDRLGDQFHGMVGLPREVSSNHKVTRAALASDYDEKFHNVGWRRGKYGRRHGSNEGPAPSGEVIGSNEANEGDDGFSAAPAAGAPKRRPQKTAPPQQTQGWEIRALGMDPVELSRTVKWVVSTLENSSWRQIDAPQLDFSERTFLRAVLNRAKELQKQGGLQIGGQRVNLDFATKETVTAVIRQAHVKTESYDKKLFESRAYALPTAGWEKMKWLTTAERQQVLEAKNGYLDSILTQTYKLMQDPSTVDPRYRQFQSGEGKRIGAADSWHKKVYRYESAEDNPSFDGVWALMGRTDCMKPGHTDNAALTYDMGAAIGAAMIDWAKRAKLTAPVERTLGLNKFQGAHTIMDNNAEILTSGF